MRFAVRRLVHVMPWLAAPLFTMALAACGDDRYEDSVDDGEETYDPTQAEGNIPLDEASPPPPEERQPMDLDEAERIDPVGEPPIAPTDAPEEPGRPPLEHPSEATEVDPVGEPTDATLPDEPTQSMDPTESPAVDPVGDPMTDDDDAAAETEEPEQR